MSTGDDLEDLAVQLKISVTGLHTISKEVCKAMLP
jgi:hypothetical protein